ncbi:DUF1906 domain-containing protein [Paenibacillus doosanensis]|uniref:DUF1906 domain-containing protein n=1 Tax=Paenibacillus doosanensis TaxID=1229154 RepID=UPI00218043A2|nr:DUF1906 domain-containing protein [Paenibacillus doosanensis]MCS7460897.1 DUF1906 domain-containing protein [Paenibacillus doosanensis]
MAKGFDCATPLTANTAAAFERDGYVFVARYLVPSSWKALTRQEVDTISNAGLQIVSVYETTADRALGARAAGLYDGASALALAGQMGQPPGSTIYFAVDFDASSAQMSSVISYIRAASEATPGYNTGVYGSYSVVEAVMAAGACSRAWQTYAWSGGKKSARANIYQYQNDITVNGIAVDLNESYGQEGWWNTAGANVSLSVSDANKLIEFMKAGYFAANDEAGKEEFHRLANELRKASGQPEE